MENFVRVASTDDLSEGEIIPVEVDGEPILLSNVEGTIYAIGGLCSHEEAPLSEGYLTGTELECPWHGSVFDLQTGESTCPPAIDPVPKYTVRIDGSDILVRLPSIE